MIILQANSHAMPSWQAKSQMPTGHGRMSTNVMPLLFLGLTYAAPLCHGAKIATKITIQEAMIHAHITSIRTATYIGRYQRRKRIVQLPNVGAGGIVKCTITGDRYEIYRQAIGRRC